MKLFYKRSIRSDVEFIAAEQLSNVAFDASERLGQLTNHRYALELDSDGGFIMRDNANGGYRRPVNTLSGGETFLASLALALSLSSQIQLRGEIPLEFFFLDEGLGTLDPDLLVVVMQTLEKLHLQNLTIGIISHVPELRNRLARRLIVTPAQPGGSGSQVKLELAQNLFTQVCFQKLASTSPAKTQSSRKKLTELGILNNYY